MELVVIGGGEHARVVMEAAQSRPDLWRIRGFVDVDPCSETEQRLGVPRLGSDDVGYRLATDPSVRFVLGLAALRSRDQKAALARAYESHGVHWGTVVHTTAWISPSSRLAHGVFVSAGAVVNSGAVVERHAIINTSAVVEHDVAVGEFAQIAPGAVVGGAARIGRNAYIGLGASVRDHVTVGDAATVGMGAVVVATVPQNAVVVGNPARQKAQR